MEGVKSESKYPDLEEDTKSMAKSKTPSKFNQKRLFPFASLTKPREQFFSYP